MNPRYLLLTAFFVVSICAFSVRVEAQFLSRPISPDQIVLDASHVLTQSVAMPSGLPQKMLASAQGIAIVPNMVRGAFVVGLQRGRGVFLFRAEDGEWQAPRMIEVTGGSLGYQVGIQSTDLILIFRTQQSVSNVLRGTLKVGVDAAAAIGPVGRQASAATDLPLQAEILSYSRARGAFVGASIDGTSISVDQGTDALYYQPPGTTPASAVQLVQLVSSLSKGGPVSSAQASSPEANSSQVPAPQAPNSLESARQDLDGASRQLAASLDDQWKRYLALPAEVYIPNHMPNIESIHQAILRYEAAARDPRYAALTNLPAFQATLNGLRRLDHLQQDGQEKLQLPAPPVAN